CGRRVFEEERYWHLKNVGDLLQPAGPDAIGAFLLFLHLLEDEAECVTQLYLAHCKHHAAHAHPAADVLVDWVSDFFHSRKHKEAPFLSMAARRPKKHFR